ncbi:TolC family protein [Niveibacterium sp. COAC-50]|uniref:TolC family protein n=1 Tax=Niveibacterium sp. COAC-50 TaxID=2729384 RepID=UPI0015526EB7|nr:TolC family protein [Niveibacterium sp. COAC-50]
MSTRICLVFSLAAALACGNALANEARAPGRSVDELLDLARSTNPTVRAAQQEAAAARERVQPAGALPDPMLKIELMDVTNMGTTSVRLSPAQVGSTQYTFSQQLPFWGKRDLRRDVAESGARVAEFTAEDMTQELLALVKRGYAQYWQVTRLQEVTQELGSLGEKMEQVARSRYASGLVAQQDVIRAQLELTSLKQEQIQLDNERQTMRAILNGLLARGPQAPLAEPEQLRSIPSPAALQMDALVDRLRGRNPQLSAELAKTLGAEKSRDLTYRNRMPDLNLGIVPVQRGSSVNEWQLMFEVNLPLQFDSRRSQEREAERMLDAARARAESTASRLIGELGGSLAALDASRRIEAITASTLLPQTEATFQSALAGYETGRVDFATLIDAQRAIRKARQDLIKARADQQARLADIERLIGEQL